MSRSRDKDPKSELNWSDYQDKQLKVLDSLKEAFNSSLNTSKLLSDNLSKMTTSIDSITRSLSSVASSVSSLYSVVSGENRAAKEFTSTMNQAANSIKNNTKIYTENSTVINYNTKVILDQTTVIQRSADQAERLMNAEAQRAAEKEKADADAEERKREQEKAIESAIDYFSSKIKDILDKAAKSANEYSALSNDLIKISGNSGALVREFREDMVWNLTGELNSITGNYYSPQEVYKQMISISKEAGIGNLDTLRELARPMMLAQESMDINIADMSILLGRWHTRYSFSSSAMESIVDDIRGSTAGNQALGESTLENLKILENVIPKYANYDPATMEQMSESVSHMTSWLESQGIDPEFVVSAMKDIAQGNPTTEVAQLLGASGLDFYSAQKLLSSSEGWESLASSLVQGAYDTASILGASPDSVNKLTMAKAAGVAGGGLTVDQLQNIYDAMSQGTFIPLSEFDTNKSPMTAAETVENKYKSVADQINDWLEKIYEKIASGQEILGFGLSDILSAILVIGGIGKGVDLLSKAGGLKNLASGGKGLLKKLISGGGTAPGLGVGGVLGVTAGAALAIDGISGVLDKDASNTSRAFSGIEAAGGIVGAGGLIAAASGFAAAGPIGWIALAAGGAALGLKHLTTALDDTAGTISSTQRELKAISDNVKDEQQSQITSLRNLVGSINDAEDFGDALSLARKSGLLPIADLNDPLLDTKEELINLIETMINSRQKLTDSVEKAAIALGIISEPKLEAENNQVKQEMRDYLSQYTNEHGSIDEGTEGYERSKSLLYDLGQSIVDDGARSKYTDMLDDMFSNGVLSADEINVLTDKSTAGSNWRSFWSGPIDRKTALYRQDIDRDTYNRVLNNYSMDPAYDTSDTKNLEKLISINEAWINASSDQKSKYEEEFEKLFLESSIELQKSAYGMARNMGLTHLYDAQEAAQYDRTAHVVGNLVGYAAGTNYISHDQVAVLHEGEAVVPKRYNPFAPSYKEAMNSNPESYNLMKRESDAVVASSEYAKLSAEVLSDIKEFLAAWKDDNKKESMRAESKYKFSRERTFLSNFAVTQE